MPKPSSDEMLEYVLQQLEQLCSEIKQYRSENGDLSETKPAINLSEVTQRAAEKHSTPTRNAQLGKLEQVITSIISERKRSASDE